MPHFPQVLLGDDRRWENTGVVAQLVGQGCTLVDDATRADVLLTFAGQPIPAGLSDEAGLVVLLTDVTDPADPADPAAGPGIAADTAGTGRRLVDLLSAAGIHPSVRPVPAGSGLDPAPVQRVGARLQPDHDDSAPATSDDLLARVDAGRLRATARLDCDGSARPILRLPGTRRTPGAVVAAAGRAADRRVVALGVNLDPGDRNSADRNTADRAGQVPTLITNAVFHAARRQTEGAPHLRSTSADQPAWLRLKAAVTEMRHLQGADGSIAENHGLAGRLQLTINDSITELSPLFPYDIDYLAVLVKDFTRWADGGFGVPDFLDSLVAFHPETDRVDGREHLVVFPMYTQNGNPDRNVEAVLLQVIWPEFVSELEAGDYSNPLFVPIRFLDFTAGYDTNSAVLFPETVAMREIPKFSWGAIFADREAARFRRVVAAAAEITGLALPPDAARLLADQELAEQTFVMWDLIHDRTHMHGDLPFDPFMIKQRMPYFLYSLEELRCDLTAFCESVRLEGQGVPHARMVQYAILFDRIFRFAITGTRVRNYDRLGGQLLFAWLHQHRVLHWTDNRLTIDWSAVTEPVLELGRQIEELYWQSIDRPKISHWLAAYQLVARTVTPHPASTWARGPRALPLDGPPKGLTDAVLPDEFPLSMFYEALNRRLSSVVASTAGITGTPG